MESEIVRISCAALCNIEIDGKYLLCMNKGQLKQGIQAYTPFGGAFEYFPEALPYLNNLVDTFERETPDLRFTTDILNVELFKRWFDRKVDREISPNRELIEELVIEEKILPFLSKKDFVSVYIKTEKDIAVKNDVQNIRFYEIFKVAFTKEVENVIKEKIALEAEKEIPHFGLFTKEEILANKALNGIKIGENANYTL